MGAFQEGGTRGIQKLANQASYQASMASAGIQMRGIALQEAYLWGGGSWSSPDPNSAWGLQDQQTQMQYRISRLILLRKIGA